MSDGGVTQRRALARVADVEEEREEAEEGAEDVLALGDPGDGLHVERVEGEEGGDDEARPGARGHHDEGEEEKERVGEVEGEVDEVMGAGVEAEELAVEHVREEREGVPVGAGVGGEGTGDAPGAKPLLYSRVFGDVGVVVVGDEAEAVDLGVDGHGRDDEGGAEGEE